MPKPKKPYSAQQQHHVRLYDDVLNSPAYLDLKPPARALLFEFLLIYRPDRNGALSITTRRATERLNITEPPVLKAFDELAAHGFIRLINHENWMERKAREWELTICPCNGREPRNDWRNWVVGANLCPLPVKKKKSRPMKTGAVLPMKSRAAIGF
jgi:hypothetical protein